MTKRGKQKQNIAQKTRSEQWCSQHKILGGDKCLDFKRAAVQYFAKR